MFHRLGAHGAHAELETVLQYAHAVVLKDVCSEIPITEAMIGSDGLVVELPVLSKLAEMVGALTTALRTMT
jgi:hypothetical protein